MQKPASLPLPAPRSFAALLAAALLAAACGGGADDPAPSQAAAAASAAPMKTRQALPSQSTWGAPFDLGFVPAAAANVPDASGEGTGRVLLWSAENRFTFTNGGNVTWSAMFDPRTNTATAPRSNATNHNMFCPGTSNLPDGRLLVSGGSTEFASSIYNAATDSWSPAPGAAMARPRAYQANTVLRDGAVFTLGGSWDGGIGGKGGEVWTAAAGWRALPGVPVTPFLTADVGGEYRSDNHMWLMPTAGGRVLHVGPSRNMNWIDPRGNGSHVPAGRRGDSADAMQGSAVMFEPGRILVTGGAPQYVAADATASAYLVDARTGSLDAAGQPQVTRLPNMAFTRVFHNGVVLPDGKVMIIGGKNRSDAFNDDGARLVPELWDPATGNFTSLPAMSVPRTYHGVAILLPDARVLSAGSGLCGCPADQPRAQVFTPYYLYNDDGVTLAPRPRISAAPRQVEYGGTLSVTTDSAVSSFVLIRLSSVTHTVNNDQRRVPLAIRSTAGNSYVLDAPTNPGIAVPGEYMLFALNARGVPSLARTVRVGGGSGIGAAPLITAVADQSGTVGAGASLTLAASGGAGGATTFSATGLPPGVTLNAATGAISGAPTTAGTYVVTAFADNGQARTSTEFAWRVGGGAPPPGGFAARFVRLESLSEVNGGVWASMAEFNVLGATFVPLPRAGWAASASSEETAAQDNRAVNAIDGNAATIWHSRWSANVPAHPHTFTVDLGSVQAIGGFQMLPRQDGTPNGTIASFRFYLSNDGVNWGSPVATGDFSTLGAVAALKEVRLAAAPPANRPPVITAPAGQVGSIGTAVSLRVSASDPDGDTLAYSATGLPPGLAIGAATGTITGTPTTAGSYTVSVTASDGRGGSATSPGFSWIIQAPAPVIQPLSAPITTAGASVTYTASASGTGVTYSWNFGDGSPDTAFSASGSITKVFASPGVYGVTLTARSSAGILSTRSFLQAVGTPATATRPTASSAIALETRAGASARLWVANPDNDTVAVIDTATNARVAEIAVGASPRSVAIAPDGRVWVTNKAASTISILSPASLSVAATVVLPRAAQPHGLVFAPGGSAFVVLEATGQLLKLDPVSGAVQGTLAVGANPRHVSAAASGALVLVSRFITNPLPGEATAAVDTTTAGAEVVAVNAGPMTLNRTIVLRHSDRVDNEVQGAGIPNYLAAAVISPDGARAWVPSKQDNVKRGTLRNGQALNFQNSVRAISSRIDMASLAEDLASRVDHDNSSLGSGAVYHPSGAYLFVALETSRQVAVVDAFRGRELAKFDVGRAPQALAVSSDGTRLYAQNFMDRTVSVIDLGPLVTQGLLQFPVLASPATVGVERLPAQVLLGKQLFYDARDPRLARDSYMSCASCHADAGHDGRTWDFSSFGEGLRNTPALAGRAGIGQGFQHWSANFDETQDFEGQIRAFAGGTGLMTDAQFNTGTRASPLGDRKAGLSADLDALAAYLASLNTFERSPGRNADGTLSAAALAGRTVFTNANCASCHAGSGFSISGDGSTLRNIGTIKPSSGQRLGAALTGIDVPTLRDVWKTGPYLHDGSAATLAAAVQAHAGNTVAGTDLTNLVAYLQQIGSEEAGPAAPPPPNQPPATAVACASEGGVCTIPAGSTATVWYGAGTSWAVRSGVTGSIGCNNGVFGDPIPGTVKSCRYQTGGTAPANQPPTVSVAAPASVVQGSAASLTATAADADGTVARVEFFAGSTLLGTDSTAPYALSWTPTAAGSFAITARAFDNAGAATTSAPVTVTVTAAPSNVPPASAVTCASEGGTCTIPAGTSATVWYGAGSTWAVRSGVTGSIGCNNGVFGDPVPGIVKTCRRQ